MPPRARPRDRWSLRPRDLPPRWALAREPRLGGLEHNAAFRRMVFERRFRLRWRSGPSADPWIAFLVVVLCVALSGPLPWLLRGLAPAGIPLGSILFWIGISIASRILQRSKRTGTPDLLHARGLGREPLADLHACGFPPRDVAIALWARSIPRFRIGLLLALPTCAWAATIPLLAAPLPSLERFASDESRTLRRIACVLVCPLLSVAFGLLVAGARNPAFFLERARLEMMERVGRRASGPGSGCFLVGLVIGALATLMAFLPDLGKREFPEEVSRWAAPASVPVAILAGLFLGWLRRRSTRRRAEAVLKGMDADIRASMETATTLRFGGERAG